MLSVSYTHLPLYYSVGQAQEMDYGWNAINMKRVAHGAISNVIIQNYTNPLYIIDVYKRQVMHRHQLDFLRGILDMAY